MWHRAKCNSKSSFPLLLVHPDYFKLLGFAFKSEFSMDRVFQCLVQHLKSSVHSRNGPCSSAQGCIILHYYLDDYHLVGPAGSGMCAQLLQAFVELAEELGVPLAHEKTKGQTSRLTFLGIELDTNHQTSRLPGSKLKELRAWLAFFLGRSKVTLHEIQQLVGHLNSACRVVALGRAFL